MCGRKKYRVPIGLAAIYCLSFTPLAAETIFLKDGRVVEGQIVKQDGHKVYLSPEGAAEPLTFLSSDILRINFGPGRITKKYIYFSDGRSVEGYIVNEDSESITVRRNLNQLAEVIYERARIVTISDKLITQSLPFTFTYDAPAESVSIEGDFTGWKEVNLERADGRWQATTEINILKKNNYQYRYIVDNRYLPKKQIRFKTANGKLIEDVDLYKFTLGLRLFYSLPRGGHEAKWKSPNPAAGLIAKTQLPFIDNSLGFQAQYSVTRLTSRRSYNSVTRFFEIDATTNFVGSVLTYTYSYKNVGISPKAGSGINVEKINIDARSYTTTNTYPLLILGTELSWEPADSYAFVLDYHSSAVVDSSKTTWFHFAGLGVNYRL